MLLTAVVFAILGFVAFGLRAPFDPRRAIFATVGGAVLGLVLGYFNMYPGSVRGALLLLAVAFLLNGLIVGRPYRPGARPIWPKLPAVGAVIMVGLILAALFPYTAWGADSVKEPIYLDLQKEPVLGDAPPLVDPRDVRVVPWDLATRILHRGYAEDGSGLTEDPTLLMRNTYPDTVNGEFLWVHAPAPATAKWLFGGRLADKVLYTHNDATNGTPTVVDGEVNVNLDSIWWQHRVARYAEEHGTLRYILEDVALQLDDDYHPYWIGYLATLDIKNQPHLAKLLVIDAWSGEETVYDPGDAPAWIEIVYPEAFVYSWAEYWGKHREGFVYRWFNADRLLTPDDVTVRYIRLENTTYWLLPMRQLNSPQLGGYILIDTRTGGATFYDRFDNALVDYETAHEQLLAIMRSGEASGGAGAISLTVSEGYLYPIEMADGTVRDAYIFPLAAGLQLSRFAIIDAHDYSTKRVFAPSIGDALTQFRGLTSGVPANGTQVAPMEVRTLVDGVIGQGKALVNLNGTLYRVTPSDLALGSRNEAEREMDELEYAIARANRGNATEIEVRFQGGRIVDVRYAAIRWGA